MTPPNIVVIMAGQLAPQFTGACGHKLAKPPHINALAARWDSVRLRAHVIDTQRSRRRLHAAMEAGAGAPRDYTPPRGASREYVRNQMGRTVAAQHCRFQPPREECDGQA